MRCARLQGRRGRIVIDSGIAYTLTGPQALTNAEALVQAMSSLNRIIAVGWVAEVTDDLTRLPGRPATAWADFVAEHRDLWL